MLIDTHAAFRDLENGGFDAEQAEALVRIINGAAGEYATKDDIKDLRRDFDGLRGEFEGLRGEFEGLRGEFQGLRGEFEDLRGEFGDLRAEFKEQFATKAELKEQFATKAELKTEIAKLETKIESASNRVLLGVLVIAGVQLAAFSLVLAALRFWPT